MNKKKRTTFCCINHSYKPYLRLTLETTKNDKYSIALSYSSEERLSVWFIKLFKTITDQLDKHREF